MKYNIGIDIGGTTVKSGLFEVSEPSEPVYTWTVDTDTENCGSRILTDSASAMLAELDRIAVPLSDITSAGIGVPGPVTGSSVVRGCPNLGWGDVNVSEEFRELTGIKNVITENDANCAALGELLFGAGKGRENCAMITLGTGTGCGIIINGEIVAGKFGAAGEIGHLPMNESETEYCGCGKKGCLEQYASATGLVHTARKLLNAGRDAGCGHPSVLRGIPLFTAKDVMDSAKSGDKVALDAVRNSADCLGKALAMISCVVDPGFFILGGGMSLAGGFFMDMVKTSYRANCYAPSRGAELRHAEHGSPAGQTGAATLGRRVR